MAYLAPSFHWVRLNSCWILNVRAPERTSLWGHLVKCYFRKLPIVITSHIQIKIENFLKKGNKLRCNRMQVSFDSQLYGQISMPTTLFLVAVPANFDRASFDPRYFMKEDVTEQKIFHTRHPTMKKFCGGLPGSPLFCNM